MISKKYYTAIVFMLDGSPARKYHNLNVDDSYFFLVRIGAEYVNLYDKNTKSFVERIYIKKGV
jgi:hypothetical protein